MILTFSLQKKVYYIFYLLKLKFRSSPNSISNVLSCGMSPKCVSRVASTKMFIEPKTLCGGISTLCVCLFVCFRTLIMVVSVISYGCLVFSRAFHCLTSHGGLCAPFGQLTKCNTNYTQQSHAPSPTSSRINKKLESKTITTQTNYHLLEVNKIIDEIAQAYYTYTKACE